MCIKNLFRGVWVSDGENKIRREGGWDDIKGEYKR